MKRTSGRANEHVQRRRYLFLRLAFARWIAANTSSCNFSLGTLCDAFFNFSASLSSLSLAKRFKRAAYLARLTSALVMVSFSVIKYPHLHIHYPFGSTISIQSTGHGGKHNSHPVQKSASTVCISFAAPTIASTGQA